MLLPALPKSYRILAYEQAARALDVNRLIALKGRHLVFDRSPRVCMGLQAKIPRWKSGLRELDPTYTSGRDTFRAIVEP